MRVRRAAFVGMALGGCIPIQSQVSEVEPTIASIHENIFRQSCIFSTCHDDKSPEGPGLELGTMDGDRASATSPEEIAIACASLINVPITNEVQLDGLDEGEKKPVRVDPGNSDMSFLINKLTFEGLVKDKSDNCIMPQCCGDDCPPLKDNEIQAVRDWIDGGTTDCK